eukprot:PLAT6100.1.p2 GENE.PLAT6100.1~~PLAT6100.1.p2  ORF type:complete len:188 (-),score=63.02 PLAT6100.1:147-710(-)
MQVLERSNLELWYEVTLHGRISYMSGACSSLLACQPGDLVGRSLWSTLPPEDGQALHGLLEAYAAGQLHAPPSMSVRRLLPSGGFLEMIVAVHSPPAAGSFVLSERPKSLAIMAEATARCLKAPFAATGAVAVAPAAAAAGDELAAAGSAVPPAVFPTADEALPKVPADVIASIDWDLLRGTARDKE